MVTNEDIKNNPKYKKFEFEWIGGTNIFYYVDAPEGDNSAPKLRGDWMKPILSENKLEFAFSEWWDFYRCRAARLREAGIDGIAIITKEEAISCGL